MITTILSIICLVTRHYFRVTWLNSFQKTGNTEQGIFQYYNEAVVGTGLPDYSGDDKQKLLTP